MNRYRAMLIATTALWAVMCVAALCMSCESERPTVAVNPATTNDSGRIKGDDIPAGPICFLTEEQIQEDFENERIEAAMIANAVRLDDCTITWYTNGTCGKTPSDPAYGITASGEKTVENLTCAVDKRVIPLYSDVFVQFADGTVKQYWATDTGVRGNHVDIFIESYDQAIINGRQKLTVWYVAPDTLR